MNWIQLVQPPTTVRYLLLFSVDGDGTEEGTPVLKVGFAVTGVPVPASAMAAGGARSPEPPRTETISAAAVNAATGHDDLSPSSSSSSSASPPVFLALQRTVVFFFAPPDADEPRAGCGAARRACPLRWLLLGPGVFTRAVTSAALTTDMLYYFWFFFLDFFIVLFSAEDANVRILSRKR